MMGIGVMPKNHPLYFGMLGNNGKPYANRAVANSDLLIIAGARIADRAVPKPENLEQQVNIIHIDIDTAEIGKNLGPTIPLVGDIKNIFDRLLQENISIDTTQWIETLHDIKKSTVDHRVFSDKLVNPMLLVQHLSEKMDDDAIYVADVGQNQLWSADNYVMKNGRFLTSGGMGTMGYSIPAGIGAKMCTPDKQVVVVCGDGSFQMTSEELAAAFLDHTPVKIALLNNSVYGMVRQWQTLFYDHHYSATNLLDGENTPDIVDVPDFVKLAEAYGCVGMRAFTKDEAIECIKKANEINDRPVLIDFRVWKDAMVWPMVAAGDSNDNVTYKPGVKPLQRAGEND